MFNANATPPEAMTPEQRRHEIAGLLANALYRLRTRDGARSREHDLKSAVGLGSSGNQSVHVNPVNNVVRR